MEGLGIDSSINVYVNSYFWLHPIPETWHIALNRREKSLPLLSWHSNKNFKS
jgi:hypothetical protein